VPYPTSVTSLHYVGLAGPLPTHVTTGEFRFTMSVERGTPVSMQAVGTTFDGLWAAISPRLQVTVPARSSRNITVILSVADCTGLDRTPEPSFLNVTLRNTRAMQEHPFPLTGAYAKDVSALVHTACTPWHARRPPLELHLR
jgi:hypothetical protein